ncbi:hypothetical protein CSA56_01915 [candidate division KSB3 bacterium]|uniref:Sigma-54-dependent Fis family transcriptional regulator n=1 Tax=candidate division KSB3 bacterium TaxID=2044937 RepID=A0A2G6KJX8_9BACT|nr:MAG: hypothetical protein CSA56_01915 [candidate division KSB3 bacterium]
MKKASILIVDDHRDNVDILTWYLEKEGYRTLSALDGPTALSLLETQTPDLILLDIMMPGMDGFEVCQHVKNNRVTKEIPVIFITSSTELANKLKGFEVGGADYLTKPFSKEEMSARISLHLATLKLQRALQDEAARFQALSGATFEGILITDQTQIVEVNQTLATISGYGRQELLGMPVQDLLVPYWRERVLDRLGSGDELPFEAELLSRHGTSIPAEIQIRTIVWQGQQRQMAAVRDISWRKILEQENRALHVTLQQRDRFGYLIGKSGLMRKVYERIIRAAASDETIIIYGESGTGKELAARTIFNLSEQHSKIFVPVNCGAIQENLFEPQFFGYRKGAFTGAERDTPGYFDRAQGGTLFLDEVGELTLPMQAKLLRVLQENTFTPVGATASRAADVRIIAATNQNLRELIQRGKVREDFFHRLHVIALELPPLRRHKEDIPLLIEDFLAQRTASGDTASVIPEEIFNRFSNYDWPGNVRELLNEVRRYVTIGEVELAYQHPPQAVRSNNAPDVQDGLPLDEAVEAFERDYITRVLHQHGGQKSKAAQALGVGRKTLYNKLKKYGKL